MSQNTIPSFSLLGIIVQEWYDWLPVLDIILFESLLV